LERLLKVKQTQKDEAMHIEETQSLVTEIEILKVVLHLLSRRKRKQVNDNDSNIKTQHENKKGFNEVLLFLNYHGMSMSIDAFYLGIFKSEVARQCDFALMANNDLVEALNQR
jgi:hypothetical protein